MQFEMYPHEDDSGDWVVEAINVEGEGEIYTTIFCGSSAKERAMEYLAWKQAMSIRPEAT